MKELLKLLAAICIILIICIVSINKFGRDKTLSMAAKILSPICLVVFYLSGFSIITPLLEFINVKNTSISSESIRVAIDSAIVAIVNIMISIFNSPIKIYVDARGSEDISPICIRHDKPKKINYSIKINDSNGLIVRLYKKFRKNITLRIVNSKYTSLCLDKEDEYKDIIDTSNSSKYIDISINNIIDEGGTYFTLSVQSNKTIKWDGQLKTELYVNNKKVKNIDSSIWYIKSDVIEMVHREEK